MYVLIVILMLLGFSLFLLVGLNFLVNDWQVKEKKDGLSLKKSHRLLAILAHPDDEVVIAGTLAKLKAKGSDIHLLYATHGEDGPTGGIVSQDKLGKTRLKELQEAAAILKADSLEVLNYPDRCLNQLAKSEFKNKLTEKIHEIRPDLIICFDDRIGLYGNEDHLYTGRLAQETAKENSHIVTDLLIMTLSKPMLKAALRFSRTFKERYDPQKGLPDANLAIRISPYGTLKKKVIQAHKTQNEVMNDVQPLWDKIPAAIYYRILSKEYFHHIKL